MPCKCVGFCDDEKKKEMMRMSRPRYWWYYNVCRIVGEYPRLDSRVRDMRRQKITPGYAATPGGQSTGREVEDIAEKVLSSREYADYEAISAAISTAKTWRDGADVLEIVRLHAWIWPRESLESAARRAHVSQSTAKRMYSRFVYEAARELGYRKN